MKRIVILILILISSISNAQHCAYDHSAIIVIKIRTNENYNTIPNLKVSLVKKGIHKMENDSKFRFTQINKFPFLTDEYSLQIPRSLNLENYIIKIESFCEFNGTKLMYYGTHTVKLSEHDKYSLCGTYDHEEYSQYNGERLYKPIEVVLSKIECM
jgi:hypothetical protein